MSTMYSRSVAMLRQAKNAIDIRYLLVLLEEIPFTFEKQEALELLASTITDWEESSRYGKGVRTTVQTIQRVHNIYESMNRLLGQYPVACIC